MSFHAFVRTQFARPVQAFQTDNGREFDNHTLRNLYSEHGILLRLSCPYTSQQNGKAEQILRTLNDSVRALLLHAALPPVFWVEALHTSTFLLNRRPCKPKSLATPFSLLFSRDPDYTFLKVFGCLCYPNTASTSTNKLSRRSVACVFIGYSQDHRGYRCYDLSTRKVLTSRHVYFDEAVVPFRSGPMASSAPTCAYNLWRPDLSANDPVAIDLVSPHPVSSPNGAPTSSAPASFGPSPTTISAPCGPTSPLQAIPVATLPDASSPEPASSTPCRQDAPPPLTAPAHPAPHPMVTRSQVGTVKPNPRYAATVTTAAISPLPRSVNQALKDPNWRSAMQLEFNALLGNNTWELVPRPCGWWAGL